MDSYLKKSFLIAFLVIFATLSLNLTLLAENYPNRDNYKYGGEMVLAKAFEPLSLSPLHTDYGDMIHALLSEPPILRDHWGNYVKAGWLESISVSPDEKSWTFYIKDGVEFHDGEPLDAEALKWNQLARKGTWRGDHLVHIPEENFIVIDENTLQLQGTQVYPNLIFNLSTPALYAGMETPESRERYGEDYGITEAYGNGPFELNEWVRDSHMILNRNENYDWGPGFVNNPGPAYLEQIRFEFVEEASTRVEMLHTGEVDGVIDVPYERVEEIEQMEGINLHTVPGTAAFFTALNVTKPPLDEIEVRKALAYAIDREAIAERIFFGYAKPAYSMYLNEEDELPTTEHMYHFNLERSQELLEQAGWVEGPDGIRERDGERLEFDLWVSNITEYRRIGEVLQGLWREIGADVNLERMEEATLRDRVANNEHEATVWQHLWRGLDQAEWEANPDHKWYPNQSGLDLPEELTEAMFNAESFEEFHRVVDEISNWVYDQAGIIRIVRPQYLMAVKDNFKDIQLREGWWAHLPYFHDVYDEEVYRANKE